ncbi:hypothetical protein GCM10023093_15700 [Nemorincola caseinilytica]|uniref:Uncharacterized protein n=1 Tax=Nemorincola caseinilytica TaxID=2054315 RepID=A0ABP8NFI5_9BACT
MVLEGNDSVGNGAAAAVLCGSGIGAAEGVSTTDGRLMGVVGATACGSSGCTACTAIGVGAIRETWAYAGSTGNNVGNDVATGRCSGAVCTGAPANAVGDMCGRLTALCSTMGDVGTGVAGAAIPAGWRVSAAGAICGI